MHVSFSSAGRAWVLLTPFLELGATVADSRATSDGAVMNQATILRTLTSYY